MHVYERVYKYIKSFIAKNGYPPNYREIMTEMDYASSHSVSDVLSRLEKKGMVELVKEDRNGVNTLRAIKIKESK